MCVYSIGKMHRVCFPFFCLHSSGNLHQGQLSHTQKTTSVKNLTPPLLTVTARGVQKCVCRRMSHCEGDSERRKEGGKEQIKGKRLCVLSLREVELVGEPIPLGL